MPLPPSAPYDSLATVTQQVRSILGDFVQNIQPNNVGVVNTAGLTVTLVSGNQFNALMNNQQILLNGIPNTVAMVTSPTTLNLVSSAGVQAGISYSLVIPTGDLFADSQNYVLPIINFAWRRLQKKLDYASHPKMRGEIDILNLPVAGSLDPAVRQWISWTQFFDGKNLTTTPTLPSDFLAPMRLRERQSVPVGQFNPNRFCDMHPATDGLPLCTKGSWNGLWDWREDALYFVGAIFNLDIHLDYYAFLPDIAVAAGGFSATPIPVMRAAEALAFYAAALFVEPRGGAALAPSFLMKGDEAADAITNRQSKTLQRGSFRRRAVYVSSGRFGR